MNCMIKYLQERCYKFDAGNRLKFVPTINKNLRKYMISTKNVFFITFFRYKGRSVIIYITNPVTRICIFTNLLAL